MKLQFFTKTYCPLCDEGLALAQVLAERFSLKLEVIDIYEQESYLEAYQLKIPVVVFGGEELGFGQLSIAEMEVKIRNRLQ